MKRWARIVGHSDYEVSRSGEVRRRTFGRGTWPGRRLTLCVTRGYAYVCLDGRRRFIHQLVCRAFCGRRPSPRYEAAHWDGDRANNRAGNLRWTTRGDNHRDAVRHGTWTNARGERNGSAKLNARKVRSIRAQLARGRNTHKKIAGRYGVSRTTVSDIANGKRWKHVKG